jgi:predicted RNA binding protein YcfA (HicA-like mRNA interferase family)
MVTAKVFMGVLEWLGFVNDRTNGSHNMYEHYDGRKVTVPEHKGRCIKKGLFFSLLRRLKLTKSEFKNAFLKCKEDLAFLFFLTCLCS